MIDAVNVLRKGTSGSIARNRSLWVFAALSMMQFASAADCVTGTCPRSSAEIAFCAAASGDGAIRHGVDLDQDITVTAGASELDSLENLRLSDGVELRQGDRVMHAPEMRRDGATGNWTITGGVQLADPNLIVRGQGAHASTADGTVDFETTTFDIPARAGHGAAGNIRLSKDGAIEFKDVRYTTCPGPKPDWDLKVSSLDIDAQAHEGSARNVWINVKGVPVFYLPYISFPVSDEPKTGLLYPNIGNSSNSGAQVSVPWYWSIAPNFDTTVTPTWYSQRGVDLGTEFRFLTRASNGVLQANYLPDDKEIGSDRSYFDIRAQTDLSPQLRLYTDGSNVGDPDWFEDFGSGLQRSGVTVLPRNVRLVYRGRDWTLSALAQNYQTIDTTIAIDDRPYTILPQLSFRGWFPDQAYGLTYDIASEYSNFRHSANSTGLDGQRFDATPEVRLPLRQGGIFLEPAVAWRYTAYQLDRPVDASSDQTPTRSAPIFSVDSGVNFERTTGSTGQRVQTLEPRLLYLYVPYRNQDALPVFDTRQPDFNLIQLFGINRYLGADRLGDANQLAMGVTSRLLDAGSGRQLLSATVGEVYRFATPRVSLPGEVLNTANSSDLIGELRLGGLKNWNAKLGAQWDPSAKDLQRTEVNIQYIPGAGRVANIAYVYRKEGLAQQPGLEQIDTSAAWPVGSRVNLFGRYVYSLKDDKTIEALAGVEYRDCCWGFRFFARQSVSLAGQLENSWQWQIELNGLASVGTGNDTFLAQSIRGYSAARLDHPSIP